MRTMLVFLMSNVALTSSQAATSSQIDVAVDLSQDVTYMQRTSDNAGGRIMMIDNKSQELKKEIFVESMMAKGSRYEIEVGAEGQIFYLIRKSSGQSQLGVIEAQADGKYQKTEIAGALDKLFLPNNLSAEPNGLLSVQSMDAKTHQAKVSFFAIQKQGETWQATMTQEASLKSIESAEVQAAAKSATAPKTYTTGKGVGFTAGLLSGVGFMYRQYFTSGLGFHAGAIAWYNDGQLWSNAGVELLKTLAQKKIWRLYALAGASVYFENNSNYMTWIPGNPDDPTDFGEYVTSSYQSTNLNFGMGLGIEVGTTDGVAAAFEVPLAVNFGSSTDTALHLTGILPIPSLSVIYYFGR